MIKKMTLVGSTTPAAAALGVSIGWAIARLFGLA